MLMKIHQDDETRESYLVVSKPYSVIDNRKTEHMVKEWLAFWVKVRCTKDLSEHFF